jgi:hypothetical protein
LTADRRAFKLLNHRLTQGEPFFQFSDFCQQNCWRFLSSSDLQPAPDPKSCLGSSQRIQPLGNQWVIKYIFATKLV